MRIAYAMVFVVIMLMGATAPNNDVVHASDMLRGVWQLTSGEAEGRALSETQLKGGKLIIEDDRYTVTLADLGTVTGIQKLGESEALKTIDIRDESGPHAGQICLGLYELNGDEFRVVFSAAGRERPSRFETTPGSGQWMHVWKRIKE